MATQKPASDEGSGAMLRSTAFELPVVKSCDGCGACCREQESPPGYVAYLTGVFDKTNENDPDAVRFVSLPGKLKAELHKYVNDMRKGKPHPRGGLCLWFDEETRKCRHYDLRPSICREAVEVGDDGCISWRKEYAATLP